MRLKRKSDYVAQVMRDIRQAALKEKNEEWRSKLWRWYYRLLHGEAEIQLMVAHSEMYCLLEIALPYGMLPDNWKEEIAKLQKDKADSDEKTKPPVDTNIDDDDIPPRQMRLFED